MSNLQDWQKALELIAQEKEAKTGSLNLRNLLLTELPPQLEELTHLTSLNLTSNSLTVLPDWLGAFSELTSLNLRDNQLTNLPISLTNLLQLNTLDLTSNQFIVLPGWLDTLSKLTSLKLKDNQLKSLPNSIGNLASLSHLNLERNQLSFLPDAFGNLTNLAYLSLEYNLFTTIPDIFKFLTNLSYLNLEYNRLTNLPDLSQLKKLSELHLCGNQISRLDIWLQDLHLKILDLRFTPLPLTPELLEVGRHNPKLILENYFGSCKPLHEAKILLIGEGEVGKTSIAHRLLYGDFNNLQGKTDGVDVYHWALPVDNHTVQINLWDFGGQEIYRSTHQFFFTKRSVYVVVVSERHDGSKVLEKWVKTVQQLAGEEAPIVVVVNKIDEHLPQLDERGLSLKYPQIAGFMYLSCKGNYTVVKGQQQEGFGALQKLIQQTVATLPHVNDLLHEAWWNVKNSLQNMSYEVMGYDKFIEICEENLVKTDIAQKLLVQLLHDLGVVVHFQGNQYLENMGVLKAEWVTNGVYTILNSEKIRSQKGRLQLGDLKEVLDKVRYPSWRHIYLIELMKHFQLCFSLPFQSNSYLIPGFLPVEQPDFPWSFHHSLVLEYQYEDFLPDSILAWLMTQTFEQIDINRSWRAGFVLQGEEAEALVIGDVEDRKLSIWVVGLGNARRSLLAVIRAKLVDIHARFQKLLFQEMCPAINTDGNIVGQIGYKALLTLESRKKMYYYDPLLDAEIDIQASLNLVERAEPNTMLELRHYLLDHWNLSELKILAIDLGINLEKTISMNQPFDLIVIDLLSYLQRRGKLAELQTIAYRRK